MQTITNWKAMFLKGIHLVDDFARLQAETSILGPPTDILGETPLIDPDFGEQTAQTGVMAC